MRLRYEGGIGVEKTLVAMSGGVDSTGVLLMLRNKGIDADGVIMLLPETDETALEDARLASEKLGAKLHILSLEKEFEKLVIDDFVNEYKACRTPNPCVVCNIKMKFGLLLDYALENGYSYLATGHYARIEESGGRFYLKKALDAKKDQSYVLYGISKDRLAHIKFPLGESVKDDVRDMLKDGNFRNAAKKDSQDICFVQKGSYADFIKEYSGEEFPCGDFCDLSGKVLGTHKGLIRYTLGQRKGLGLALPQSMYVTRLDGENNRVILGLEPDLYSKRLEADNVNLIAVDKITDGMRVNARARYNMKEEPARVFDGDNGKIIVEFEKPQRAITPGQSVVLYDGDTVVGGGRII